MPALRSEASTTLCVEQPLEHFKAQQTVTPAPLPGAATAAPKRKGGERIRKRWMAEAQADEPEWRSRRGGGRPSVPCCQRKPTATGSLKLGSSDFRHRPFQELGHSQWI